MELLPLEVVLQKVAGDKSQFPSMVGNYFDLYMGIRNELIVSIYPHIDTGLAVNSGETSGFYTAHNAAHFDEVIRYAGNLLGIVSGNEDIKLQPYELYKLLVAIRIHDAGNIHGRPEHEKLCFSVLKSCTTSGTNDAEKKLIANIAQAHGGKTGSGSKDTISELQSKDIVGPLKIRPQLIASIVRFADEICENNGRAAVYSMEHGAMPSHSEIFHRYAASIQGNNVSDNRVTLKYVLSVEDAMRTWEYIVDGALTQAYLIDVIYERLEKMDRERRYCNRYSKELYSIDSIRATISIVDPKKQNDVVELIAVPELRDNGYPDEESGYVKKRLQAQCGSALHEKLSKLDTGT